MRSQYKRAACSGVTVLLLSHLLLLHPRPCTAVTAEAMQAIVPLAQLASGAFSSGAFTDLSSLGGKASADGNNRCCNHSVEQDVVHPLCKVCQGVPATAVQENCSTVWLGLLERLLLSKSFIDRGS